MDVDSDSSGGSIIPEPLPDNVKFQISLVKTEKDGKQKKLDVLVGGKRDAAIRTVLQQRIKTLLQNRRRQSNRIKKLKNEMTSLRDKLNLQASFIHILCEMIGDADLKERFRGRQGMGILGDTKRADDYVSGVARAGCVESGTSTPFDAATSEDSDDDPDRHRKKKDSEFYYVEDLDDLQDDDDCTSRSDKSEDIGILKQEDDSLEDIKATDIVDKPESTSVEGEVIARPLIIDKVSSSVGADENGTTDKEVPADEMSALTIAVVEQDSVHTMANTFSQSDGKQVGKNNGQDGIHHDVVDVPSVRRLCEFAGQVGESLFAQATRQTTAETNPFGNMRVQVANDEPFRMPMPPGISNSMAMSGNQGLTLFPALISRMDDPFNVRSDDSSSFGPLIIETSGRNIGQATPLSPVIVSSDPSSHGVVNIGSVDYPGSSLIVAPGDLHNEADLVGSNQPTALVISIPSSTEEVPPQAASDLSELFQQPSHEWDSPTRPELIMPHTSDTESAQSFDGNQDDFYSNLSPLPQEVLDEELFQLL